MLEMLEIEIYPLGDWEPVQTIFSHQSIDRLPPHLVILVECPIIPRDLGPILNKLQLLLENLPNQLPLKPISITVPDASHYASLICFKPDDELVDLTGSEAGALNVHLEHVFGYSAARAMVQVDQPLLSARAETVAGNHRVTIDEAFDNW